MSNSSKKDLETEFRNSYIQKCPHDAENPYCMVSNALIRDSSISPACRWLIIFLLSNKSNWRIEAGSIIAHLKGMPGYGRDNVYALLNEAIKSGYMKREEIIVKGLKRYNYFLSEKPKFKKSLPYPETPYTENQGTTEGSSLTSYEVRLDPEPSSMKKQQQRPRKKKKEGSEAKASVVVFSCLENLKLTDAMKESLCKKHEEAVLEKAVNRVLAWTTREDDTKALLHAIKEAETWVDGVNMEKVIEENKSYLNQLKRLDNQNVGIYRVDILSKGIEFSVGMQVTIFNIDDREFIVKVKDFITKNNKRK